MTVFDYRSPCQGEVIQSCMIVSQADEEPGLFYNSIEGFSYQWGYQSEILVDITEVEDPPTDGSSLEYRMIELVDRNPVASGTTFEVVMRPGYATTNGSGGFVFPEGRELVCEDADLCDDVGERLADPEDPGFTLVIGHPSDPTDASAPLVAQEIR